MKKELSKLTDKELEEVYDMVGQELEKMLLTVEDKTGYYATGLFSLFGDRAKKCVDIDLKIGLLQRPHGIDESKVKHYMKHNPDNVLNKPILAHKHNSWYMIYDGVHRTEANRRLNKESIKAHIITPSFDEE